MANFGFDTLGFVKRLSAAGMETRQAEALADAINEVAFDSVVTRSDLAEVRAEVRELGLAFRAEMKELELRITGRMGALIAGSTALTVAILGALITLH